MARLQNQADGDLVYGDYWEHAMQQTVIALSCVRTDIACEKRIVKDTGWRSDELPPRYSVYPTTRPRATRWEWRCLMLESKDDQTSYRLLIEVSPAFDKWKAMLIRTPSGGSPIAIMRFEDQPGAQGGLHIHANCDQNSDLCGAESVRMAYTLPDHGQHRRRHGGWTKALFCKAAGSFFRTDTIAGQEELGV